MDEHCECENNVLIKIIIAALVLVLSFVMPDKVKILFCLVAYLIVGLNVLFRALKNTLSLNVFDENFLMSVATIGAFALGEYPEAVMVMLLYQIGEFLQDKAVDKSRNSIAALMDIRPDYANVMRGDEFVKVSPQDVNIGDVILVRAGEKIPMDGTVLEGEAFIDTSALTGEPVPKKLLSGDIAISGCINTNGMLKIRVDKLFGESTVSKILELVENAASQKAKSEKFISKFARYYTPIVVLAAIFLAFIPPLLFGEEFRLWLFRALTFLVISCPCALVISVPLGFFAGIGGASKKGVLIKGSCYIEALSKPFAIFFDKTGTLTKGSFCVTKIVPLADISDSQMLEYAAYAENFSNHPIANSIKSCYKHNIDSKRIKDVTEIAGEGIKVKIDEHDILVGNYKLMINNKISCSETQEFGTVLYLAKDGVYLGYIVIADELKQDTISSIKELKIFTENLVMLTGDSSAAAEYIAHEVGMTSFYSQLMPQQKVEKLEAAIANKPKAESVIFVGDGINDAPVLTRADVGIAMGALGSDSAIEAADVVIMDDKLSKIVLTIKLAKKVMAIVKQNICFAIGVKILFLILGSLGLVTMWGAVFADVGVTLIAVANSMRSINGNI